MIKEDVLDLLRNIIEQLEVNNPGYEFMWLVSDERASCILYYQTPTKEEDETLESELEVAFSNNYDSFLQVDDERNYFLVASHDNSNIIQDNVAVLDEVIEITTTPYMK